jgi:hypothetical protein
MREDTSVITIREATVITNRPITITEIDPASDLNLSFRLKPKPEMLLSS